MEVVLAVLLVGVVTVTEVVVVGATEGLEVDSVVVITMLVVVGVGAVVLGVPEGEHHS